jgi:predicted ester cyclase
MSTEQNKAVVRRFITEVLTGRNTGLADELLAPNYVNRAMGMDLAGFKAMGAGLGAAIPDIRFAIENLVAEGDAVVARFTMEGTHTGSLMGESPSGKKISARGLTYYSLANGRIVEDDPMTTPDLMQLFGAQAPAGTGR